MSMNDRDMDYIASSFGNKMGRVIGKHMYDYLICRLWIDVFISCSGSRFGVDAREIADKAVEAFKKRFPA